MKQWRLWDFPDSLYVYFNPDFRERFFNEMFLIHGVKRPYARFLGLTQKAVKTYWRGYNKYNGRKLKQYVPLWVLKKSCSTKGIKKR